MRSLIATLALLAFLLPAAQGQGLPHEYEATCSGSDTGSGVTCTLQLAASAARWVRVKSIFIQCSTNCDVTQTRDGTAATATAATIRKVNPSASWIAAPVAAVYSASNVGAGTPIGPTTLTVAATPAYQVLDGSSILMEAGAASVQNYNLKVTCTCNFVVTNHWEERPRF